VYVVSNAFDIDAGIDCRFISEFPVWICDFNIPKIDG
jgi:hypothetical protein